MVSIDLEEGEAEGKEGVVEMLQGYVSSHINWSDIEVDESGRKVDVRFRDLSAARAMVEDMSNHQRNATLLSKLATFCVLFGLISHLEFKRHCRSRRCCF